MNRSALLVIFSVFEGNNTYSSNLMQEELQGSCYWSRTGLGMTCDISCWWERAYLPFLSCPTEIEDHDHFCAEPWHLSSIPPVQCSAAGAVADPGVGELPQLLLVTTAVMSLVPVKGPSFWAALHCDTSCSTVAPSACWAEPGLHHLYVAPIRTGPFGLLWVFLPCSDTLIIQRVQQLKNYLCTEMKKVKMKKKQL